MEKQVILKDGRILHLFRPRGENAGELLEYLKVVGGETDFLLFGADGLPITVEQEANLLEGFYQDTRGGFFAGRIDGEIACTFNLMCHNRARMSHVCEIALASKRKFWGIGVGSAMLETLIALAKSQGLRAMELGVYADNARARALYTKFGFEQIGLHKNRFYVNGVYHDEILMDLDLTKEPV